MMRATAFVSFALLVLAATAQDEHTQEAGVLTQSVQAGQQFTDELLHKNVAPPATSAVPAAPATPPPSPTTPPPSTQFIPAPVIVTTPKPTTAPATTAPSTTPPPTTATVTKCLATQYLYSNGTCLTCGGGLANGTCLTGVATIVGGRCNGVGACVGTTIQFCNGDSSSIPCANNPGKFEQYCDVAGDPTTLAAQKAAGFTGVLETAYSNANPFCNLDSDCALGYWCDGYYKSTAVNATHNGQCVQTC